jgi:hypothetical protein
MAAGTLLSCLFFIPELIKVGMPLTQVAPTDCGLAFADVEWTILS